MEEYAKSIVVKGANENENPIYPGTAQDEEAMRTILNEEPINLQGDITNSSYYILTTTDLDGLGVKVPEGQEYLVDYKTGEIWDKTNVKYEDGTYAYLGGTEDNNQDLKENFADSLIDVVLKQNWNENFYSNSYVAKLKITDEMFDISELTAEGNSLNIDDFNQGRLTVKINESTITVTSVSFIDIGDKEYEATLEIPKATAQALTNIDGTGDVEITILTNSIIDDSGNVNDKVVISSVINTGEKALDINMAFSSNIVYETKTERYPDGYTDENGKTWGTGATVDLILTEPNGFRDSNYRFDYVWKETSGAPLESEWDSQMIVHTTRGETSVIAKVYVNEGSGEGTLYLRPSPINNSDFANSLISANINLDNTAPHITSNMIDYIDNPYNIIGYYNSNNSIMAEPRILASSVDFLHLIDDETGIMKCEDLTSDILRLSQAWSRDNLNVPDEFGNMSTLGWSMHYLFHDEINSHNHYYDFGSVTKNTLHPGTSSGMYYLWVMEMYREQSGAKVNIIDCVGNELEQPYVNEGLYIDFNEPKFNSTLQLNNNGTKSATIVLTDDFSGLSKDANVLKKIKYKWITDITNYDNTNMTQVSESNNRIEYSVLNQFGEYNRLEFQVTTSDISAVGLYLEIDGFTDIAGNPITVNKVLQEDFCDYVDIEVKEKNEKNQYNAIGYPITCEINCIAKDENGNNDSSGVLCLKEITYNHVGLNDCIKVSDSAIGIGNYIACFDSHTNGPIDIVATFINSQGDEFRVEKTYTIQNVVETIFEIDLSKIDSTEYMIPMYMDFGGSKYNEKRIEPIYVDWGDGKSNYLDEYAIIYRKYQQSILDQYGLTNGYFFGNNGVHNYDDKGRYFIKISGACVADSKFSAEEDLYEPIIQFKRHDLGGFNNSEDPNNDLVKERYNNTKNGIIGIKQFGIHYNVETQSGIYDMKKSMFEGCSNLEYLPKANDTEYEINQGRISFKYVSDFSNMFCDTAIKNLDEKMFSECEHITSMSNTFSSTNIESIPNNFFKFESCKDSIENRMINYCSTFAGCNKLKSIPSDLFHYGKGTIFQGTFSGCTSIGIDDPNYSIPEDLFEGQNKSYNFDSTFKSCKNINVLPADLFKDCSYGVSFCHTFEGTGIYTIPDEFFAKTCLTNSKYLCSFIGVFKDCKNLQTIGNGIFKSAEESYSFGSAFSGCKNLIAIPDDLFEYNSDVNSFEYVFGGCESITSIPNNLFRTSLMSTRSGSDDYIDFNNAFYNSGVEEVSSAIFWDKNDPDNANISFKMNYVRNIYEMFSHCKNLKKVTDGLFKDCTQVYTAHGIFWGCENLEEVSSDLFKNCTSIKNIGCLFSGCKKLRKLGKNAFDSIISSCFGTFADCTLGDMLITVDHSLVGNGKYRGAFYQCESLPLSECPEVWKWPQIIKPGGMEIKAIKLHDGRILWNGFASPSPGLYRMNTFCDANPEITDAIEEYYNEYNRTHPGNELSPDYLRIIELTEDPPIVLINP